MLGTDNFLRYFFGTFLTLLLMVNIIYAFNLVGALGLPFAYSSGINDYSDKYFGFSSLFNSFTSFFGNNGAMNGFKNVLNWWFDKMRYVDISQITGGYTEFWGGATSGDNYLATLLSILNIVHSIFNLLANVPYIIMVIIYFLLFLFYVLGWIFMGISYACYLFSGLAYSLLPNTYLIFSPF